MNILTQIRYGGIISSSRFAPPTPSNVALSSLGATITASSNATANLVPERLINGWNHPNYIWNSPGPISDGGGWEAASVPAWFEVLLPTVMTISAIDYYTLRDYYAGGPPEPDLIETFTLYGCINFDIKKWNGSSYDLLNSITGNNKIWRHFDYTPFLSDRIRVEIPSGASRSISIRIWAV